ncbi:MAG: hypothetical protein EHM45_06260 [Desulfobacteraceae bacterium]|nr:MAG: hypothetical protein EHM45_06260 [Desulfobacteraceae bacterium]
MESRFDQFARRFVRAYWETVKADIFAMPPNEPVEESLEELLAAVSHETEMENERRQSTPVFRLRMTHRLGDWWLFCFRDGSRGWELLAASARSNDEQKPHDLLGPAYDRWFRPFLAHVTELARKKDVIEPQSGGYSPPAARPSKPTP